MKDPDWHHGDIEELPYTEAPTEPEDSLDWLERGSSVGKRAYDSITVCCHGKRRASSNE